MTPDSSPATPSRATRGISLGKDLVALLRDAALFLLTALLILFPAQFNTILVNAGFEEGSLVGFKWKNKLVETNSALEDAQKTITSLQGKNDELVKALAEANSKLQDPALMQRLTQLGSENKTLKEATRQVQTNVSQTIASNIPLVEKAMSSTDRRTSQPRSKSEYNVGLQTLGVPDAERLAINEKLSKDGYGLDPTTWSYTAGDKPSWFAPRSTVFYYASSAQPAAQELTHFMQSVTGQEFAVQRGAGLGVDPSRKDVTLYVHYIKR